MNEEKRNQLNLEIAKAQGELSFLKIKKNSENYIVDKMKTFTSMFPYMTFNEKRAVVEELVDSISISDNEIQFSLYYLPFFQKELSSMEKKVRTPVVAVAFFQKAKLIIKRSYRNFK